MWYLPITSLWFSVKFKQSLFNVSIFAFSWMFAWVIVFSSLRLDIWFFIFCFDICILFFNLDVLFSPFAFFVFSSFAWIFGLVMTALSDLHIIFNSNLVGGIPSDHIVSSMRKIKTPYILGSPIIVIIIVRYSLLTPGYILRHQRISWGAGDNRSGTFKASSKYYHHHHYCCCYYQYNHYHHGERMLC